MPRPVRSVRSPRAIAGVAVAVLLAAVSAVLGAYTARGTASATALEGLVVRVVDGDTIHVRIGDRVEKVRYIGVNTPETHHPRRGVEAGGREAHDVNRDLVTGKRVRLELDVQERDRHGRLLAYVWVGDLMVNAELVRRGYAKVLTVPPNVRYQERLLALQREARGAGRGLWGAGAAASPATG